jgi:hypothetical protein
MSQYRVVPNDFFSATYRGAREGAYPTQSYSASVPEYFIEQLTELVNAGNVIDKISYYTTVMITGGNNPIDPHQKFGSKDLTVEEFAAIGGDIKGWVARQRETALEEIDLYMKDRYGAAPEFQGDTD